MRTLGVGAQTRATLRHKPPRGVEFLKRWGIPASHSCLSFSLGLDSSPEPQDVELGTSFAFCNDYAVAFFGMSGETGCWASSCGDIAVDDCCAVNKEVHVRSAIASSDRGWCEATADRRSM